MPSSAAVGKRLLFRCFASRSSAAGTSLRLCQSSFRTILLLAVGSCGDAGEPFGQQETRHPQEGLIPAGEISHTIDRADTVVRPGGPTSLRQLANRLHHAREVYSVGVLDAPEHAVWARIEDAAADSGGNVYVLDSQHHQIRRFDPSGEFSGSFGSEGSGPLDFQDPVALELTRSEHLALITRSGRTKVVAPDDSGFTYVRQLTSVLGGARDGCILDDQLYIHGSTPQTNHLIQVLSLDDQLIGEFGSRYQADHWLVETRMSTGMVACVQDPPTVVFAFHSIPYVKAYSADGTLRWTTKIGDYTPPALIARSSTEGSPSVEIDYSAESDRVFRLEDTPDASVIIQVLRAGPADPERRGDRPVLGLRTYALSAATGDGVFLGESVPALLDIGRSHYYAMKPDSTNFVPIFSVYQY